MNNIFNNQLLRDWTFENFKQPAYSQPVKIATIGSGPFEENEFDNFLERLGFEVSGIEDINEIMVVGKDNWDANDLEGLLKNQIGESLKVYSQEMFLSFLLTKKDPFDADEDTITAFGEGHSALEYLMNFGFDWPSTWVPENFGQESNNELSVEFNKIGPLRILGYKVGNTGLDKIKRRKLLSDAYESQWTRDIRMHYNEIDDWGKPHTKQRLVKVASSLAAFCRNLKRKRTGDYSTAIAHYEEDLEWLKKKYYLDNRYSFLWPDTSVI